MVKKLKKMAEKQAAAPTGLLDGLMSGNLKDSAQQLWQAGQEALAKAQGGRDKVLDSSMIALGASAISLCAIGFLPLPGWQIWRGRDVSLCPSGGAKPAIFPKRASLPLSC